MCVYCMSIVASMLVIFFLIVKLKGIKNESDNLAHASDDGLGQA